MTATQMFFMSALILIAPTMSERKAVRWSILLIAVGWTLFLLELLA